MTSSEEKSLWRAGVQRERERETEIRVGNEGVREGSVCLRAD